MFRSHNGTPVSAADTDGTNLQTRMVAYKDRARYFPFTTHRLPDRPILPSSTRGVVSKRG